MDRFDGRAWMDLRFELWSFAGIPPNPEQTEAPELVDLRFVGTSFPKKQWTMLRALRKIALTWWNWANASPLKGMVLRNFINDEIWRMDQQRLSEIRQHIFVLIQCPIARSGEHHVLLRQKSTWYSWPRYSIWSIRNWPYVSKLDPEWVVYTYQKGHPWAKMKLLVKSSKCYTNLLTTSGDSIRVHHRYNYHKGPVPVGCPFNCSYYFVSQNLARGAHGSKEKDMTWRLASNGGTLTKINRYCSWKVRGLEAETHLLLGGLLVQPGKWEP